MPVHRSGRGDEIACSTPEGIGGGISVAKQIVDVTFVRVLNARRHRRGNQTWKTQAEDSTPNVLNARRHRRGNQVPCATRGQFLVANVLNARRHRRGNQDPESGDESEEG